MNETKKRCRSFALLIVITALSLAPARAEDPPPTPSAPPPPVVQLIIELTDGSRIIGAPIDLAALPLKLEFTKLEIPLHLLAQCEFTANRAAFAVKFRNNDTLTGSLDLERVKVKTSYGDATIPATRIARMTFTLPAVKP